MIMEKQITLFVGEEIQKFPYLKELDYHVNNWYGGDNYYHHYGGTKEKSNSDKKLKIIYEYIGHDLYNELWLNLCKERKKYSDYIFFHRLYKTIDMLYGLIEDGNIKDKYSIKKKKYKIEKITFEDISEVFRVSNHKQYERSFLKRGFDYPKERKNEGIIHRLPTSYLTNKIIEIGDGDLDKDKEVKKVINYITKNIEDHITSIDDIDKYDIIATESMSNIIKEGDRIEVKKNSINVSDSYYSEPLTSPVKRSGSIIPKNENYLHIYNSIIGGIYKNLNGKKIGNRILELYKKNIKGIMLEDYVFVPIENIELYLSNKGRSSSHQRLTIRYRFIDDKNVKFLNSSKKLSNFKEKIKLSNKKEYLL
tara:strand:+ start:197 stop:1291 length:1095 start_codon:yes stop_codon:yes gene_type:complete